MIVDAREPRTGAGRTSLHALYVVAFLSSLGFSIVIPFLVFLVTRFGGNAFVYGALGAVFWAAQLVGAPWLGALSDRVGRKRVLFLSQLGAMGAWSIFLVALYAPAVELARVDTSVTGAFALTLPLLLIVLSRLSDGLFNGSISVANAYMADVADEDERKLGYARLGAASNLGFVIGPLLASLLARAQARVSVVVVLALVLSASAARLVQRRLPDVRPRPTTPRQVLATGGSKAQKPLGGGCRESVQLPRGALARVLAVRELRPLIALYFTIYVGFSVFTAALPLHAARDLDWTSGRLGVLFTALAIALVATEMFVLPPLARRVSSAWLGAAGSVVVAVSYLLMTRHSDAALYLGAIFYGAGNGVMWPSYLVLLSRRGPPELQGAVQGTGSSAGSLASIFGTLAGGAIFERIGAATFVVSAVALAAATALFASAARRREAAA